MGMGLERKFFAIFALVLFSLSSCSIKVNDGGSSNSNKSVSNVDYTQLRPLLNSERIKSKFGSYGIEVLESGKKIRVSNLYSISHNQKTTRTLAIVRYPDIIDPLFFKEHNEILEGKSIGAVFKRNGWKIEKRHQYFGNIDASEDLAPVYKLFGEITPTKVAIHIYSFFIKKNSSEFLYARIAEIHHPKYLTLKELKQIYRADFEKYQQTSDEVRNFLRVIDNTIKTLN